MIGSTLNHLKGGDDLRGNKGAVNNYRNDIY
jgi:hypothetical protein